MSPMHGAEQRPIWYRRQGRERFAKNVSLQLRRRNSFCSRFSVSRTALALGYGPNKRPGSLRGPR